jgi:hypothetical protein
VDVTITLTIDHVDGPMVDVDRLTQAAIEAICGETLEILSYPPNHRSRYVVEDGEVYA